MRTGMTWLSAVLLTLVGLSPARAELKIENVQVSHGLLGPIRESMDVFPYDELFCRFMITGATVNEKGEASPAVTVRVLDSGGTEIFSDTTPVKGVLALGGTQLPGTASVILDEGLPPGSYTLDVRVEDQFAGGAASFQKEFTFKKAEFAIVSPRFAYDQDLKVPAPVGGLVSQTLFFQLRTIGFDRTQGKIDAEMEVQVLDDQDKPQMPEPIRAALTNSDPDIVKQAPYLTFTGQMALNRAGDFKLRILVKDKVAGAETSFEAPLLVVPAQSETP